MKRIYIIVVASLVLLNAYLFKTINDLQDRIDTTDDLVINNAINSFTDEITEAVKDVDKFIVSVKTINRSGTGFIYKYEDNKAYIITAAHVVKDDSTVSVEFNNYRSVTAEVIGTDQNTDIAVLRADTEFSVIPAKLSKNSVINNGEFAIVAGANSNSGLNTYKTLGIISSTMDFDRINGVLNAYIVTDNRVNVGYSGGPLINIASEVIGMCVMESNIYSNTYSITADEIKLVAESIIEKGTVNKYDLGIKFKPVRDMETYQKSALAITADIFEGIYVYDVTNAGYGLSLGIKTGDIIISINDKTINNLEDYLKALYETKGSLIITLKRGEEEQIIEALTEVSGD